MAEMPVGIADPSIIQQIMGSATPDPGLVDVFRRVRQDARSDAKPIDTAVPVPIAFIFDGAGTLPNANDRLVLPVGNLNAKIIGATVVSDDVCIAEIDLRRGQALTWPNAAPMYDVIPSLGSQLDPLNPTTAASAVLDVTNWNVTIQAGDVLSAQLVLISGAATCVTLTLSCVRLSLSTVSLDVTDTVGTGVTDSDGNTVVSRN